MKQPGWMRVSADVAAGNIEAPMTKVLNPAERLRGRLGVQQRNRRLQRTNYLCEMCQAEGRTTAATIVDHIKPLALGGEDIDENTRNLCHPCHTKRTAEQFGHRSCLSIGTDGWPVG